MSDEPLTKRDLEGFATKRDLEQLFTEMKNFVLERETSLVWKVITLQLAVIGGIAAAQFGLIYFILTHWKP